MTGLQEYQAVLSYLSALTRCEHQSNRSPGDIGSAMTSSEFIIGELRCAIRRIESLQEAA